MIITKGGDNMKQFIPKCSKVITNVALAITSVSVNSTCPFATYQPKLPKEAKQLRKF